ncbi:S-adenosyl-L-methionine-dependent methyltransferase [Gracilaria domingensis]|nr:S-adenosyl-L-methionine-dependent methyltransferase [Gracilaria domingensis]
MAYRGLSLQVFDSQMHSFERLSEVHRSLIPTLPIRLSHAAEAVEHNADVIERIAELAGIDSVFDPDEITAEELEQTVADFPDVVDGLLAIVRDWSIVGEKDRMLTYDPIINALDEAVEDAITSGAVPDRTSFSVLVPSASLGRLSWELARLGLSVQGVENSYLQLFMCNFVLNGKATPEKPLHLYPFVHHTGMIRSIDEQLKEVEFPDANPRLLEGAHFTMVAGEFLDLYDEEERWDAIATCFSIENSHSIITYIRRIAKVLKVGAVWVNHGCLDFKYDDSLTETSVEITKEELDLVIARCGLRVIRREKLRCRPPYVVNGMITEEYESYLTVAVCSKKQVRYRLGNAGFILMLPVWKDTAST